MYIYNTLTKQKEEFIPREDKKVQMFVCGPTVYDYIHIGNARTFVFFDMVAKYLRYRGYEVEYIQNITDVDDKIIARAKEAGKDPLLLAKKYEEVFLSDMKAIGVDAVSQYARATDYINEVVAQVKNLIEKGHAYLIENDGWYFDLSTFPEYGKLSDRTTEMADDAVSRIDENLHKRNRGDFALWKLSKEGEPFWETELGKGRPGWHIEDTAITEKYLGPQYDLHGGGQDLMFPHHEAEIAQQESASGLKPFVKYWMHSGFLVNKEKKMSKSLGNFLTLNEALKNYSPEALRFYFLSAHYRSPLDFSKEILKQAEAAVERIRQLFLKLQGLPLEHLGNEAVTKTILETRGKIENAMDNEFNTPKAFADIFKLVNMANIGIQDGTLGAQSKKELLSFLNWISSLFGIVLTQKSEVPEEILKLVYDERERERYNKNFVAADQLRSQIESLGYQIDDTIYGPLVKKK